MTVTTAEYAASVLARGEDLRFEAEDPERFIAQDCMQPYVAATRFEDGSVLLEREGGTQQNPCTRWAARKGLPKRGNWQPTI